MKRQKKSKVFIRPKNVLWYPISITFFLRLAWIFFVDFSDFLEYEMTNEKKMFVGLWIRESASPWVCNKKKLEQFLYLYMFQSAPNLVHLFIDTAPKQVFFPFFNCYCFFGFFCFYGTWTIFEVECIPRPNRFFMVAYRVNGSF